MKNCAVVRSLQHALAMIAHTKIFFCWSRADLVMELRTDSKPYL